MPSTPADLNPDELRELDALLTAVPAPWEALDLIMLDGYLCGQLVQPRPLEAAAWWGPIFGDAPDPLQAHSPGWHPAKHARLTALVERRMAAIEQGLHHQGWFDPILPADEPQAPSTAPDTPKFECLSFWAAGFEWALAHATSLEDAALSGVPDLLDSIWRHLPEQDESQLELTRALDQDHPLRHLDEAIEQLVFDVADLYDLAQQERLRTPPLQRAHPKVSRNAPCPCGSGRKYKHCHGASV